MYDLFVVVLVISGLIFAIVAGLVVVALIRGRARTDDPKQVHGRSGAEIRWMIAPTLVVLWIGAISAKLVMTMSAVPDIHPEPAEGDEPEVLVVGHQWWWEVRYPGTDVVTANEIHVPTGERIRVRVESADVIHCFWVPQLARKIDAIPGHPNYVWLEAERPGVYQGRCAEFCGTQHAWMNFTVESHDPAEYNAWLKRQAADAAPAAQGDAAAGEAYFFEQTCANCHAIRGTAAKADVAPDLTHLADREWLAGGAIRNSRENLAIWLRDPQAIKPGCKMPNFKMTEEQIRDLVAFLWGSESATAAEGASP